MYTDGVSPRPTILSNLLSAWKSPVLHNLVQYTSGVCHGNPFYVLFEQKNSKNHRFVIITEGGQHFIYMFNFIMTYEKEITLDHLKCKYNCKTSLFISLSLYLMLQNFTVFNFTTQCYTSDRLRNSLHPTLEFMKFTLNLTLLSP